MTPDRHDESNSDYMTPREAAQALHVTTRTLTRMADRGEVEVSVLPSGHRRYLRSSIESALKAAS